MRIAFIGVASNTHLQRWARWLTARGHELALVTQDEPTEPIPGAEWLPPRWSKALNAVAFGLFRHRRSAEFFAPWAVRPVLKAWKPDIVHGFDALNNGWAAVRALPDARTVVEPFGSDVFTGWKAGKTEAFLVRQSIRRADAITCNLPTIGPFLTRTLGITPRLAWGFSWGVDLDVFRPEPSAGDPDWRRALEISAEAPILFSPRGLAAYQGQDYWGSLDVMDAFARLAPEIPDLHLAVLTSRTDPVVLKDWKSRKLALGTDARRVIEIPQRLNSQEMAALYRTSDVFASVPYTDLLSCTVLEGLACGSQAVAGGCPDLGPVLRDSHGMELEVVAPRDPDALAEAIRRSLSRRDERPEIAKTNRRAISHYHDREKQAHRLEELYERLMGKKSV
ncbi:glycosyltransferase family 4 protein [bacterium]|nr:glycosyltransferase family 4 protein [bacterium]